MNRRLKIKLVSFFILAVLLGVYIKLYAYSKVLSDTYMEQYEAVGNDYEKYPGEKVFLNVQKSNLQGAWGELELTPFILEPTADFIIQQTHFDDLYEMFGSSNHWIFKNASLEEVASLFQKAGLDKTTCYELLVNTTPITDGKGFVTTPPDAVLWSLSAENRARLYPMSGKYIDNTMYNQPPYYSSSDSTEWFYNSGLRTEVSEKLQKLIYVEDVTSYISDLHLILPLLNNDGERIRLLQLLYRMRSLEVQLKIKEGQDVSKIAEYWGRFGRRELIEPMLKSMSSSSGGGEIEISELLPQIPQSRLNTYSGAAEYETDYKDCHWTTINFFNEEADESYYKAENLLSIVNAISKPSENTKPELGDVISIFNENDELTHSCIYIADNLVLTKNGIGNLNPFVITFLDQTVPLYGSKTVYYSRTVGDTHSIDLERVE